MAKKRGKFRLNGVGTKTEQHAERALRLAKLNSPNADPLAYLCSPRIQPGSKTGRRGT